MEDRETARMPKYGESKTTRIMMATVPNVTSGLGLRKFQADGFLLTRVYMTCNEGWCTLLYYVRLMSPWMRPCKHGYYVSSRATIKFSGRTLPHGVCWENCTFLIFTFVYSMDGHTVLQELILSYLLVYLLATYCTSHITCCHSTHPLLLCPRHSSLDQTDSII